MSELVEIWHVFDKKGSAPHRFKIARAGSVGAVVGGTLAQASGWRHLETFATFKEKLPGMIQVNILDAGAGDSRGDPHRFKITSEPGTHKNHLGWTLRDSFYAYPSQQQTGPDVPSLALKGTIQFNILDAYKPHRFKLCSEDGSAKAHSGWRHCSVFFAHSLSLLDSADVLKEHEVTAAVSIPTHLLVPVRLLTFLLLLIIRFGFHVIEIVSYLVYTFTRKW